ncbi:TPA: hypothetical protein ACWLUJ_005752 [Pseudomonas aeruginosa]|nr:hypothetical protein [Pseudomonas aeruginosa]
MTVATTNQTTDTFRPAVGQTLFMGYQNNMPYLVTVTGFHSDPSFTSELFSFTVHRTGRKDSSTLDGFKFFPEAAIDSKFVYAVMQRSEDFNYTIEEAYFFDPQSAFDHIAAIESGAATHRFGSDAAYDRSYFVQVEQII